MVAVNVIHRCMFIAGKETIDTLFMLQEKFDRKKKKMYVCLVDVWKAFDRVPKEVIELALRKKRVHENLVQVEMRLYDGVRAKVIVRNGPSEVSKVKVGLHYRDLLYLHCCLLL